MPRLCKRCRAHHDANTSCDEVLAGLVRGLHPGRRRTTIDDVADEEEEALAERYERLSRDRSDYERAVDAAWRAGKEGL